MKTRFSFTADEEYTAERKRRRKHRGIVALLSVLVAGGITGVLTMPALTLSQNKCGAEEHIHTADCYAPGSETQLVCSLKSLGIHSHGEGCYNENGKLICGQVDFVVHTHGGGCFDSNGTLVCLFPEIEAHLHEDSCYQTDDPVVVDPGHQHSDGCYPWEKGENLICGQTESAGHQHEAGCYTTETKLTCGQEADTGHSHGAQCLDESGSVICGQEEREGHQHDDRCYTAVETLVCGLSESAGHQHSDGCYERVKGELICSEAEREPVIQPGDKHLICDKPEIQLHTHTDSCYTETENHEKLLTCGLPEIKEHSHGESCFQPVEVLICPLEEHIHSEACLSDPNADVETPEDWEKTLPQTLTGNYPTDLVMIAKSQLGYQESKENFVLGESGERKGYSRYGAWQGDPYENWNAAFVVFCLKFTNIGNVPEFTDGASWLDSLTGEGSLCQPSEGYIPEAGSLVFFNGEDGTARVAIVTEVTEASGEEPGKLEAVGGDLEDQVQVIALELGSSKILGYYQLPVEAPKEFQLAASLENGLTVTLRGDTSSLPYPASEITLTVREVEDEGALALCGQGQSTDEPEPEEDFLLDISLWHGEEEIEPTGSVTMEISGLDIQGKYPQVTHIDTENQTVTNMPAAVAEDGSVTVETDHFSLYRVTARAPQARTATTDLSLLESGQSVTLNGDVHTDKTFQVGNGAILDLNGYDIYFSGSGNLFEVLSGKSFTIIDSSEKGSEDVEPVSDSLYGNLANVTFNEIAAGEANTLYLQPNGNWLEAGAWFAAYFFEGSQNTWRSMTAVGDGTYQCDIPAGYSNVIFVRMNPAATNTSWNNKWNQTADLTIPTDGNNLFTVGEGQWGDDKNKATGNWSKKTKQSVSTLTYYVTESTASGTGTTETLEKHTVSNGNGLPGCIIAEQQGFNKSLVWVQNGGTLTVNDGLFTVKKAGAGHAIANDGTLNINGGYFCGCNTSASGGAIWSVGDVTMQGGVIAGNSGKNGGGLYVQNSSFTMSGGVISGNVVNTCTGNGAATEGHGGGVFTNNTTVNISGGYITNNRYNGWCNVDGSSDHGGGGIATKGGSLTMSGGYVTGNYSNEAGGGMYVGHYGNDSLHFGTTFSMTGGTVASNYCENAEGGGIRLSGFSRGVINAASTSPVYITNNKMNSDFDWGGGGIFVQTKGDMVIYSSLISRNSAEGFGGGVAACPTGDILVTHKQGSAIYDNTASGTKLSGGGQGKNDDSVTLLRDKDFKGNQNNYQDYYCTNQEADRTVTLVMGEMLGGGAANWSGRVDGQPTTVSKNGYTVSQWLCGLTAKPSDGDKQSAVGAATTFITGNSSATHGGGVMTNGGLTLGNTTDVTTLRPSLNIEGTKAVVKDGQSLTANNPELAGYKFLLLEKEPALNESGTGWIYAKDTVIGEATTGEDGKFTLSTKAKYDESSTYTYYLVEEIGNNSAVTYDKSIYKIKVTVVSQQRKVLDVTFTSYYVKEATICKVDSTDTVDATMKQNSDETYTLAFKGTSFTNQVTTPVQFQITKTNTSGSALKNISFSLKNAADSTKVVDKVTDENGLAVFDVERNTTYWLYEGSNSDYLPAGPWILEVGNPTAKPATDTKLYEAVVGADGKLTKKDSGKVLTASSENNVFIVNADIVNIPWSVELPKTGGEGTLVYTWGGMALICAGACMYCVQGKKRRGHGKPRNRGYLPKSP